MKVNLPPRDYLPSDETLKAVACALGFHCAQQFFDTAQTSHSIMFRLICWQHDQIERLQRVASEAQPEPMIP